MLATEPQFANIVDMAEAMAAGRPQADAVLVPRRRGSQYEYRRWSFTELLADVNQLAYGLRSLGMVAGQRVVLTVPHSYEFIALTFGILKTGATLVLVDPGMGRRNVLRCLKSIRPDGFVAIPIVHAMRRLLGGELRTAKLNVVVGQSWISSAPSLRDVRGLAEAHPRQPWEAPSGDAAIIFTSGSTGPAKGVLFSHTNFVAQCEQIREMYGIEPGGYDLAAFPLFGLFNVAMGTATVIPDMDAARPASVDPRRFVQHFRDLNVSQSFASPAVWNAVGRYCHDHGIRLPGLRRVLIAGAPVPPRTLRWMTDCIAENGQIHTPYGATEALPVASISAQEVLADTAPLSAQGRGTCVGRRFAAVAWAVIEITDGPIASLEEVVPCATGSIGELIVRGPQVTRRYLTSDQANADHKIHDGQSVWHRMGDVGYLDELERFWFCGRKAHRVVTPHGTLFSVPVESVFNEHPMIYRSALVGLGQPPRQTPVIICEPWRNDWPKTSRAGLQLRQELHELVQANAVTASIGLHQIMLKASLPVDTRHNSKIFREQLVPWARRRCRGWQ